MTEPTLPFAFVAKMSAKETHGDELCTLLTDALALANAEPGTALWFALRSDATTFWIFDAFASTADRDAHAGGAIVDALAANADRLLSMPPEIIAADVLAEKLAIAG